MRDGRNTERLVKEIEEALAPAGFTVELNEQPTDEDGRIIAEFDIRIQGPIGSSHVDWLIECRDRPSDGPAPASWIEQLVGRRIRFKFDRVFAVSTTGFAKPAQDFAKQERIYLRSVTSLKELASDFKSIFVRYVTYQFNFLKNGKFDLVEAAGSEGVFLRNDDPTGNIELTLPAFLRLDPDAPWTPISDFFFQRFLKDVPPQAFEQRNVDTLYSEIEVGGRVYGRHADGKIGELSLLSVQFSVTKHVAQARALTATVYKEARRLGYLAEFVAVTPAGEIRQDVLVAEPEAGPITAIGFEPHVQPYDCHSMSGALPPSPFRNTN